MIFVGSRALKVAYVPVKYTRKAVPSGCDQRGGKVMEGKVGAHLGPGGVEPGRLVEMVPEGLGRPDGWEICLLQGASEQEFRLSPCWGRPRRDAHGERWGAKSLV